LSNLRNFFWALALCVIAAYLFFLALGAFAVDEVVVLSVVVGILVLLWVVHAVLQARNHDRDPRLVHARERRGF
jgi:uncharacterized membrane protein YdjX (TVP38/TMEM64 family)